MEPQQPEQNSSPQPEVASQVFDSEAQTRGGDALQGQQAPNKKKWLIIGIVVFVVLTIAVALISTLYINRIYQKVIEFESSSTSELPPAPHPVPGEPTIDETANWKTYTDILFSIKLPSQWKEYSNGNPIQFINYDIGSSPGRDFDSVLDKGKLKIEIYTEDTTKDLKSYVAQAKVNATEIMGNNLVWTESTATVNNQVVIKVKTSKPGFVLYAKHPSNSAVLSIAFALDFDNYPDLTNQILSTFKFTQ